MKYVIKDKKSGKYLTSTRIVEDNTMSDDIEKAAIFNSEKNLRKAMKEPRKWIIEKNYMNKDLVIVPCEIVPKLEQCIELPINEIYIGEEEL